eukprot:8043954-Pyramimonas_sp.AAC.1
MTVKARVSGVSTLCSNLVHRGSGGRLEGVWRASGGGLKGVWRGSEGRLEGVRRGSGGDLEGVPTGVEVVDEQLHVALELALL